MRRPSSSVITWLSTNLWKPGHVGENLKATKRVWGPVPIPDQGLKEPKAYNGSEKGGWKGRKGSKHRVGTEREPEAGAGVSLDCRRKESLRRKEDSQPSSAFSMVKQETVRRNESFLLPPTGLQQHKLAHRNRLVYTIIVLRGALHQG